MSPHVFEADGSKFHYAMPINAITSIMNRATGVALTVGESYKSDILDVGLVPFLMRIPAHSSYLQK